MAPALTGLVTPPLVKVIRLHPVAVGVQVAVFKGVFVGELVGVEVGLFVGVLVGVDVGVEKSIGFTVTSEVKVKGWTMIATKGADPSCPATPASVVDMSPEAEEDNTYLTEAETSEDPNDPVKVMELAKGALPTSTPSFHN